MHTTLSLLLALLLTYLPLTLSQQLTLHLPAQIHGSSLSPSTSATLTTAYQRTLRAPLLRSNAFVFRNLTAGSSYLLNVHSPEWTFAPCRVDVVSVAAAADAGQARAGKKKKTMKIQVFRTFLGNSWEQRGAVKMLSDDDDGEGEGGVSVELEVLGRKEYYSAREGCMCFILYSQIIEPFSSPSQKKKKNGELIICPPKKQKQKVSLTSLFKNPMILLALLSLGIVFGMPYLLDNSKSHHIPPASPS